MKKIILLFSIIILVTGCSNSKEQELCNKIDAIDARSYAKSNNYEELTSILEDNYNNYCSTSNTELCNQLKDFIKASKEEITKEDCSSLKGDWKNACEKVNETKLIKKNLSVTHEYEKIWAVCNN